MKNRRTFLLTLTAGLVAAAVIITPVIAEEIFGFITNVDVAGKTITIVPFKGEDGVEVKTTDSTAQRFLAAISTSTGGSTSPASAPMAGASPPPPSAPPPPPAGAAQTYPMADPQPGKEPK